MSSSAPSILPLPAEVTAQIGSSSQITSLSDVALELLKNSIDAGARRVNVSLDLGRACCTVEDDGEGIEPNEFCEEGGLAKLHCRLTIHYGRIIARQTSAAAHQRLSFFDRGTRVVIRDLFGHLPVRVKQRAHLADGGTESERRWEQLRRGVTGLLLASGHALDVVVRDVEGRVKINIRGIHSPLAIDSDHTSISSFRRILSQVGYLSMSSWVSWIPVSNSAWNISITGVISLEPAPSKQIQFLCLGIRPLSFEGHNLLYEEINRIFAESHFGDLDDGHEPISDTERERRTKDRRFKRDGYTSKQLRRTRKGLDRWPMFVLRIDLARGREMVKVAEDVLESGNASDSILELLTAMLTRFLFQHQHRPQPLRTPFRVESNVNENEPPNDRGTSNHRCTPSNRPGGFAMTVKRIPRHLGIAKATRLPGLYRSDTGQVMASNPLNACVSLPCFARRVSPSSGASFADWSRMKSARPSALGQIYGFEGDVRKPMTAPSAGTCRKRAAIAATRPETAPAATINVDTVSCPLKGVPFIQDADEVMEWFDPTKRVVIRINARTGFIAPRESSRWARISTTSTEDMPQPTNRQSLTLKSGTTSSAAREPGPWLGDVLKDWQNPIYKPTESAIHRLPVDEIRLDSATPRFGNIKSRTALLSSKLSKDALRRARVISQVDRKFILVKMRISTERGIERSDCAGREGLVLIDQHAADERCRIEALFSELCSPPEISIPVMSSLGLRSRILTHAIVPPLVYDLLKPDLDLFRRHAAHFAEWGIIYDLLTSTVKGGERSKVSEETSLQVTSLPPTIAERCRATPRILIELLRAEVWKIQDGLVPAIATGSSCCRHDPEGSCGEVSHPEAHRIESTVIASGEPRLPSEETSDWPTRIHSCPAGVIDVLNSRACRGTCFNTLDRAEFR